jgi:8-oxo-dGTP pyrophosphatase MutT (NUDIX family)
MAFLGGMYVFPGGNVTSEDCTEKMLRRSWGLSANAARKMLGAHLPPQIALGHWVAGIREVYEEVGIVFGLAENGTEIAATDPALIERLRQKRPALLTKAVTFESLLTSEGLLCDLSRLVYFSHWETPTESPTRFDTRFYIAPLPEQQTPLPNPSEVEHSLWLTPDRALSLFEREQLPMIFSTFASLRTLADFESLESVFREYPPASVRC